MVFRMKSAIAAAVVFALAACHGAEAGGEAVARAAARAAEARAAARAAEARTAEEAAAARAAEEAAAQRPREGLGVSNTIGDVAGEGGRHASEAARKVIDYYEQRNAQATADPDPPGP